MILRNPENGSPIKTRVGLKYWEIKPGETLEFTEEVAKDLVSRYSFLEKIDPEEKAEVLEAAEGYKCSKCGYDNKVKVAVMNHVKAHDKEKVEYKTAEPTGDVDLSRSRRTIFDVRSMQRTRATFADRPEEFNDVTGPEFYGEGLVEERA